MVVHLERGMGEEGVDGPLDTAQQVGPAVAVQVGRPGVGSVDGERCKGFAVQLELSGQVKNGRPWRSDVGQQVDVTTTGGVVDQVQPAIAVPVDGAEGLGPVLLATNNAVVDIPAIDELQAASAEGEMGSAHINSSELNSGLFYGYVVVDVPLLVSNLQGCPRGEWREADRDLAGKVVERLIHLMATVSPGAKLGATAPYAWSELVLIESGSTQPRTLANAFRRPVDRPLDLLANSYKAMAAHLEQLDAMYGVRTERRLSGVGPIDELARAVGVEKPVPLAEAASWAAEQVGG